MFAVVSPGVKVEELADANWFEWLVIAHNDASQLSDDIIRSLFNEFLKSNPEPDIDGDIDVYYLWHDNANGAFKTFMASKGYTVFQSPNGSNLIWLVS